MRHIREKIVNIQLFCTLSQNYTLEEVNDPSTLPPNPQNFIPPGKFCPSVPKERTTLWPLVSCFWKLLYRFDIIITKIAVAFAHAFKATQMDRHSQIQEYAVFVHSTLNIVHDVVHFIHLHTEFAKIIFWCSHQLFVSTQATIVRGELDSSYREFPYRATIL